MLFSVNFARPLAPRIIKVCSSVNYGKYLALIFFPYRRNQLEVEAFLTQQTLLAEFLTHLKRLKDDQLMQLRRETSVIQADLDKVNKVIQVNIANNIRKER